jgi:RNA polymerase sporulation-specific sigma factor
MVQTKVDTLELIKRYKQGEKELLNLIVTENQALAYSLVNRYKVSKKEEKEDLNQVAIIGLLKAINNFDFNYEVNFSTYAVPKIAGEIKRFLRDDGIIKVSRTLRENAAKVSAAVSNYESTHGTQPRLSDICAITGLDREDVAACMDAPSTAQSLDAEISDGLRLMDTVDSGFEEQKLVEHIALRQAMDELDELWRTIIILRYFRGLTQQETAGRMGINQVQVSRIERKAFEKLRKRLVTI